MVNSLFQDDAQELLYKTAIFFLELHKYKIYDEYNILLMI